MAMKQWNYLTNIYRSKVSPSLALGSSETVANSRKKIVLKNQKMIHRVRIMNIQEFKQQNPAYKDVPTYN